MPTLITRVTSIIRANINELIDSAEDPEAMLNQIIRDGRDALRQADSDLADQIAQQKMIEGDLDKAQKNEAAWQTKAELAVSKSRDDLAREALVRVNDFTEQVTIYTKQLEAQKHAVEDLRSKRDQLKSKIDSADRNKSMLIARAHAAQAKSNMAKTANTTVNMSTASELERMERKIREKEARADADAEVAEGKTSVEDEFDQLANNDKVADQLAALKAKMGQPVAAS